ncbi:MAG: DUF2905 domain-containing protein [Deltaproteobacteria bacterium]|nr:DUF2905 domain-containing protein [Deltaproteobacteria bacterium]
MAEIARFLIISGVLLVVIGVVILLAPQVPWLGKLPLDFTYKRDNFTFYFPLGTCILLSIILSIIFALWRK